MFWLCYYNGYDKPKIECAFSYPYMLCEYAKKFIDPKKFECYTVFCSDYVGSFSLKKFFENN